MCFFFTCCYIGVGKYGAVAVPVPGLYSHSVILPTLKLSQVTGSAGWATGVHVSVGLSDDCVIICSSANPPRHRHYAREAVQGGSHICRITRCWRRKGSIATVNLSLLCFCNPSYYFMLWNLTWGYFCLDLMAKTINLKKWVECLSCLLTQVNQTLKIIVST